MLGFLFLIILCFFRSAKDILSASVNFSIFLLKQLVLFLWISVPSFSKCLIQGQSHGWLVLLLAGPGLGKYGGIMCLCEYVCVSA